MFRFIIKQQQQRLCQKTVEYFVAETYFYWFWFIPFIQLIFVVVHLKMDVWKKLKFSSLNYYDKSKNCRKKFSSSTKMMITTNINNNNVHSCQSNQPTNRPSGMKQHESDAYDSQTHTQPNDIKKKNTMPRPNVLIS